MIHRGDASTQKKKAIRERQERNTSTKQSPMSKLTIFQARNSVARAREPASPKNQARVIRPRGRSPEVKVTMDTSVSKVHIGTDSTPRMEHLELTTKVYCPTVDSGAHWNLRGSSHKTHETIPRTSPHGYPTPARLRYPCTVNQISEPSPVIAKMDGWYLNDCRRGQI